MAKNKQKTVPLDQAWQDYWSILFAGSSNWKSDLERAILRRIVLLEFGNVAMVCTDNQITIPVWAENLKIELNDRVITMSICDGKTLSCPLFVEGLIETNPHWNHKHPIEELTSPISNSKYFQAQRESDCKKILKNAIIGIGPAIQKAVYKAIRNGLLETFARPSQSPLAETKLVPLSTFTSPFTLDIHGNMIELSDGGKISSVSLCPSSEKSDRNSIRSADLILHAEMRGIIRKTGISIVGAAKKVLVKATRQEGASDASVIDRLRRGYTRYMKTTQKKKNPKKLIKFKQ